MNKKIYIVSFFIVYLLLAIIGWLSLFSNNYIEINTYSRYQKNYLLLFVSVGIIIWVIILKWIKLVFPEKFWKTNASFISKYFLPVFYIVLFSGINMAICLLFNVDFGTNQRIIVHGFIREKESKSTGRNGRSYYLFINDTTTGKVYKLKVKRGIFLSSQINREFNKELSIGKLGIVYRKEE
jgi:hypothetical protein